MARRAIYVYDVKCPKCGCLAKMPKFTVYFVRKLEHTKRALCGC